jgi:multiple sugar transport system substrate-binding protein
MAAAARAYRSMRPDVVVECGVRPLASFNDQLPGEAGDGYDLIFVDHPMIGAAVERGDLVPLDGHLPADGLDRIAAETVGQESYRWAGRRWALGVDAACQVAAVRIDRVDDAPRTWDEILSLAARAPGLVALPLHPSDAFCTLVSLSANAALAATGRADWLRPEAVEFLAALVRQVDPTCFELNPPRLLEAMAGESAIGYAPFVFGYATLARPPLTFTDVPGVDGRPRGAVLGGAGLALVPGRPHAEPAAAFAAWCMQPEVQRKVLLPAGGQPGHRRVWDDPASGAFFADTRQSLAHAYMRPRDPWWPAFQREAGVALAGFLHEGVKPASIHRRLLDLADLHREVRP